MKPEQPPKAAPRRVYRKPVLQVYGNIRTITRSVAGMGAMDGGMGMGTNKTG